MKITSKFMTGIVSKLANHWLSKKSIDAMVKLNEVQVNMYEEKTHIHLDIDADLSKSELDKLLKSIGI